MNYQVTPIPDTPIQTKYALKKGSKVLIDGNLSVLGKNFASGGEADLFFLDNNYVEVAKIYKSNKLTERKKAKLDKLQALGITDEHICSPVSKIYDKDGAFIGFTMKKSGSTKSGKTLKQRLMLFDSEGFAGWTRKDIVQMLVTILNLLFKLYSVPNHQILIGDINLDNFIVHSPVDIYLVDVDSVQIDEFPCPVGQPNFVPAELQGVQFSRYLRKPEHEMFSIACLFFLCLFNNKNPFACIDGETPQDNIKAGNFPYLSDGTVTDSVPPGNWQYYWAFLPDYIRKAFCDSFTAVPSQRTRITKWKDLLERYLSEFDNYVALDKMANDIIQTRYPLWMRNTLVRCPGCGEYFPEKQINEYSHVCKTCDMQGIQVKEVSCFCCGKSMFILPEQVKNRISEELLYCKDCLKEIQVECEICNSIYFTKKYKKDICICPTCQKEIDDLKERCNQLISYYNSLVFDGIDFSSRERRLSEVSDILPELSRFHPRFDDETVALEKIRDFVRYERNAFEDIQRQISADTEKAYTKEHLDYWKNLLRKIRGMKFEANGQKYSYSFLPLYNACSIAIEQHIKEIGVYIDEEKAKTKAAFNRYEKSLLKGDGKKFIESTISEQIDEEKGILQKASKLLENARSNGTDYSDEQAKLAQLSALVEKESDIFTEIQGQLIADKYFHNRKTLESMKKYKKTLECGNIAIGNELVTYSCFPMYKSCCLAIQDYIKKAEEYIDLCEKECQRKAHERNRQLAQWGKSILCALGVFVAVGLLYLLLTWHGVTKIILTILVVGVVYLVFLLMCSLGTGGQYILGAIVVAIFGIIGIWRSDIGTGISNYFITHFELYLYIDIGISFISIFIFKKILSR